MGFAASLAAKAFVFAAPILASVDAPHFRRRLWIQSKWSCWFHPIVDLSNLIWSNLFYFYSLLVGGLNPSEKYSSIGMMSNPIFLGKWNWWQPNHQPVNLFFPPLGETPAFLAPDQPCFQLPRPAELTTGDLWRCQLTSPYLRGILLGFHGNVCSVFPWDSWDWTSNTEVFSWGFSGTPTTLGI